MLSKLSLFGRTEIEAYHITMRYGTDTPPRGAAFGNPPTELLLKDMEVKDTFKAYLAHTGQSQLQIKRPFYEADQPIADSLHALIVANLTEYIAGQNQTVH